jgi:hypothetical protein
VLKAKNKNSKIDSFVTKMFRQLGVVKFDDREKSFKANFVMNYLTVNEDFEGETKKQILKYVFDLFFIK